MWVLFTGEIPDVSVHSVGLHLTHLLLPGWFPVRLKQFIVTVCPVTDSYFTVYYYCQQNRNLKKDIASLFSEWYLLILQKWVSRQNAYGEQLHYIMQGYTTSKQCIVTLYIYIYIQIYKINIYTKYIYIYRPKTTNPTRGQNLKYTGLVLTEGVGTVM